ncbi:hypothetical protein VTL71DRAFT_692 [Oculimacula yallundae]|uniref:Uncharacterized protein n=1 Tax=Oculimacula yallundae TaxID=86028 RepID=A0ABR4D0V2_9HELO
MATPTSTLYISSTSFSIHPTSTFTVYPHLEYYASGILSSMGPARSSYFSSLATLDSSQCVDDNGFPCSSFERDVKEYVWCEIQPFCTINRPYTSLILPSPTTAAVTSGPWAPQNTAPGSVPTLGLFGDRGFAVNLFITLCWNLFIILVTCVFFVIILWLLCSMSSEAEADTTRRAFHLDAPFLLVLLCVWVLMTASCLFLIRISSTGTQMSLLDLNLALTRSFVTSTVASLANEILIDKCMRRINIQALHPKDHCHSSDSLRAASPDWLSTFHRAITGTLSLKEGRFIAGRLILRFGTSLSFVLLQPSLELGTPTYSVKTRLSWLDNNTAEWISSYEASVPYERRTYYLGVAIGVHICSIVAGFGMAHLTPWTAFDKRYEDQNLFDAYVPYLAKVPTGSIATSIQVANVLEHSELGLTTPAPSLTVHHRPGRQIQKKAYGVAFGISTTISMGLLLFAANASYREFIDYTCFDNIIGTTYNHCTTSAKANVARVAFAICFTIMGVGYSQIRDFMVWTCAVEQLTMSMHDREEPRTGTTRDNNGNTRQYIIDPFRGLDYLGLTSTFSLFQQSNRHRTQGTKSGSLQRMCFIQSVAVRLLTVFAVVGLSRARHLDINLDLRMVLWPMVFLWPVIFLPVLIWFVIPFQAPIGPQDGWRWAKLAFDAIGGEPGTYGVLRGLARISPDVLPFKRENLL